MWYDSYVDLYTAVPNDPLVVTQFIEATELFYVQGPKSNIEVVGDYLHAEDGRFEGKKYHCDPVPSFRARYGE
jgi:hypothetical protein